MIDSAFVHSLLLNRLRTSLYMVMKLYSDD